MNKKIIIFVLIFFIVLFLSKYTSELEIKRSFHPLILGKKLFFDLESSDTVVVFGDYKNIYEDSLNSIKKWTKVPTKGIYYYFRTSKPQETYIIQIK